MDSSELSKYSGKTVDEVIKELQEREQLIKDKETALNTFINNQKGKYFKVVSNRDGASYYYIVDDRLLAVKISIYGNSYREENTRFNYLWFTIPEIGQVPTYGTIVATEITKELFDEVRALSNLFEKYKK